MELSNIPKDIFRDKIMPFVYCTQPDSLLNDIKSFYNTKEKIENIYSSLYSTYLSTSEDDNSSAWLSNDIARFLNDDKPTMYGYTPFYIQAYKRMYMNRSKDADTISQIIHQYEMASSTKHINISLGLLTVLERSSLERFLRY